MHDIITVVLSCGTSHYLRIFLIYSIGTIREINNFYMPGKNPGTSTKVMIGMLKASQNLTNRAPFTEALMSKQPVR